MAGDEPARFTMSRSELNSMSLDLLMALADKAGVGYKDLTQDELLAKLLRHGENQ